MPDSSSDDRKHTLEQTPPHSKAAEMAVLGAMLFDPRAIEQVADIMPVEALYFEHHRKVCRAIFRLYFNGKAADTVTVAELLKATNEIESVGGSVALAELGESVPIATHVIEYAEIVVAHWRRRKIIEAAHDITADAFDKSVPIDQCLEKASQIFFSAVEDSGTTEAQHVRDSALEGIEIAKRAKATGGLVGIRSHLTELDGLLGGFKNGNYIVIAGRPSMGKTALALTLALNFTAANPLVKNCMPSRGLIFSLEQSSQELSLRMLSMISRVPYTKLLYGKTDATDEDRVQKHYDAYLAKAPMYIVDSANNGIYGISAKCRKIKRMHGLDFVIIDYLQLLGAGDMVRRNANRNEEVSVLSRSLKLLARELDVPVIVLSQLSRAVESRDGRRPVMSDLRDSGSIEQDADAIIFLFREEYYWQMNHPHEDAPANLLNKAELIVAKNRTGGTTGIADTTFLKECMVFTDRATWGD